VHKTAEAVAEAGSELAAEQSSETGSHSSGEAVIEAAHAPESAADAASSPTDTATDTAPVIEESDGLAPETETDGLGVNTGLEESSDTDAGDDTIGEVPARPGRRERLEQEGDIAADYLEELLEITDLDGDLDMDVEGDRATVSIVGANLPQLVGDQGEVLEALQELTRLAVYRETGERSRLMLDVSGYRAARRTALEAQATEVVAQVKQSGERATLEPMSPFERKVVHDVVAASGLKSESEGTEPRRYVVVLPA
jgi:spoIIIJ-associated protein